MRKSTADAFRRVFPHEYREQIAVLYDTLEKRDITADEFLSQSLDIILLHRKTTM